MCQLFSARLEGTAIIEGPMVLARATVLPDDRIRRNAIRVVVEMLHQN